MSVFDVFKICGGPSSSHTAGPMMAARRFLLDCGALKQAVGMTHVHGAPELSGVNHATDNAVILSLMEETPEGMDPDMVTNRLDKTVLDGRPKLPGESGMYFQSATDLVWYKQSSAPEYPNGMHFVLRPADGGTKMGCVAAQNARRYVETLAG